ncbi:MAG: hypothetical protein CR217_17765 [Beijerinckiaceae bacterium]|nr:MAG: hypothetical protein CR217_17765 [Beijerinckiaceae bacterium]
MSDVEDFSPLSDEEIADIERARRLIADEEWKAAYRKGWRERNGPRKRPPPPSPPPALALTAHFAAYRRHKGARHGGKRAAHKARLSPPE